MWILIALLSAIDVGQIRYATCDLYAENDIVIAGAELPCRSGGCDFDGLPIYVTVTFDVDKTGKIIVVSVDADDSLIEAVTRRQVSNFVLQPGEICEGLTFTVEYTRENQGLEPLP